MNLLISLQYFLWCYLAAISSLNFSAEQTKKHLWRACQILNDYSIKAIAIMTWQTFDNFCWMHLWKGYCPLCFSLVCCPSQAVQRQHDGTAIKQSQKNLTTKHSWHGVTRMGCKVKCFQIGVDDLDKIFCHSVFNYTALLTYIVI